MKTNCFLILALPLALALAGCGTPGFPRQSYDEKKQIKALEEEFEPPKLISNYYTLTRNATEEEKKSGRNNIIGGRLALINLNYNQFVARFSVTKQSLDFGTEVTELGLNLATTAVGGAATKTILGAVSSGVTGSKLAVDKNFFFEKTVPVLVTSMNAQRKEALAPILTGMKQGTDDYPLAQALADLDNYYFAGTFLGALQAIQTDAGAKEKDAQLKIDSIRFEEDEAALQLRAWLWPQGPDKPINEDNLKALRKKFEEFKFEKRVLIERFLEDAKYKQQRQRAVRELNVPAVK
ncbi:MAG: hypothetical protein HZA89_12655 [Verrucomicrobia bacterium]|nr:hypothetical protein [Verrucomicrobiota bacterium]